MEKFSYALEFYHRDLFDLNNVDEFQRAVEVAEATENHFMKYTSAIETIRVNILLSYRFKRDLSLEDRINHVRGISYSKQFLNEEDVFKMIQEFDKKEKKIYERSLFDVRIISSEFDYEFYYNYFENFFKDENVDKLKNSPMIKELVRQAKKSYEEEIKKLEEELAKDNSVKLEDRKKDIYDDYPEEDFKDEEPETKISIDELSLIERLVLSKEYYPVYKEGLLKSKGITEGDPACEKVVEGMDDYNSYVSNLYEDTYNFLRKEFFRTMKNLTFVI